MKQREIFLSSEGDAWFARNKADLSARRTRAHDDPVLRELPDILKTAPDGNLRVLEIGCGSGDRLAWLGALGAHCVGLDPSGEAVAAAQASGIKAVRGTADALPFETHAFDVVIFGFCLYLCDRDDLFRIAAEADRVLRPPGWLVIYDFFSPLPRVRAYRHRPDVRTFKMDYRSLFTWHPDYVCLTHEVRHHDDAAYTDSAEDWVAVSVLRKGLPATGFVESGH